MCVPSGARRPERPHRARAVRDQEVATGACVCRRRRSPARGAGRHRRSGGGWARGTRSSRAPAHRPPPMSPAAYGTLRTLPSPSDPSSRARRPRPSARGRPRRPAIGCGLPRPPRRRCRRAPTPAALRRAAADRELTRDDPIADPHLDPAPDGVDVRPTRLAGPHVDPTPIAEGCSASPRPAVRTSSCFAAVDHHDVEHPVEVEVGDGGASRARW